MNGLSGFSGSRIGMYAHIAEVMAEARLEESPRCGIQRLAR
jgi:hypothetical protein